jgi:hypothetical protein
MVYMRLQIKHIEQSRICIRFEGDTRNMGAHAVEPKGKPASFETGVAR